MTRVPEAGATGEQRGSVELRGVTRRFGTTTAVDALDLHVRAGEFLSLLGPSGCGKTTTLRMLAGFEHPDEGEILLDGRDVAAVPAHKRDVNTVFQHYALFPHLTVAENIAFGLRQRRVDKTELRRRVADALEMVSMSRFAGRKPKQLSGGQQQRVALARALVNRPALLLLDEPLGALDRKLRSEMQVELKLLQSEVGVTFVYVTHDQEEALSMSDRIAVMLDGRIQQLDGPEDVYDRPASAFVAGFIGTSTFLPGTAVAGGGVLLDDTDRPVPAGHTAGTVRPGDRVLAALRPEHVTVAAVDAVRPDDEGGSVTGVLASIAPLGEVVQHVVRLPGGRDLVARSPRRGGPGLPAGSAVRCTWQTGALQVFAGEDTDRVLAATGSVLRTPDASAPDARATDARATGPSAPDPSAPALSAP